MIHSPTTLEMTQILWIQESRKACACSIFYVLVFCSSSLMMTNITNEVMQQPPYQWQYVMES